MSTRRTAAAFLVAASVLCVGAEARAAKPDPYLLEAKRHYEALDYEKCVHRLALAERWDNTPAEQVDVAIYQGLCTFELDQRERAAAHFRAALRLDERATLPPYTSPKIVEVFDAVAADVRAARARDKATSTSAAGPAALSTTPAGRSPGTDERRPWYRPPVLTIVLGAGAIAAGATGGVLTLRADGLADDANGARFESDAYEIGERARGTMVGANVAFGVATIAAAVAVVYWLVAPP